MESLKGSYGYAHSGYVVTADSYYFFASAGTLKSDGSGNLTVVDTTSLDGEVTRNRQLTGTYTMTQACTGSLVLKDGAQTVGSLDFTLTNGGKNVKFIQIDTGAVITGAAELQ